MNSIKRPETKSILSTSSLTMASSVNATQPITSANTLPTIANPNTKEGYLELILGPMFSGKTSTLKKIYDQCIYCNIPVMVINYSADNRYCDASMMSTHDKIMIPCIKSTTILEILENHKHTLETAEVILINEGQFFSDISHVIELVEIRHKRVYICGLDGDFQKNKIGSLLDLIPHCDNVCKLKSLCSECRSGKSGLFSYRITNEKDQVVIGVENYKPVCRSCFERLSNSKEQSEKIENQ